MSEPLVVMAETDTPAVVATAPAVTVVVTEATSSQVIETTGTAPSQVVVTDGLPETAVIVQEATSVVVTEPTVSEVIVAGIQGPPGPQGEIGPAGGAAFTAPAGETLSGHRVVRLVEGVAWYCDTDTLAHAGTAIGLTTGAALVGEQATIQTLGNLIEPSWSWVEGPIYLGSQGLITQMPTGLFAQQVAVALSATEININPQLAVVRS